MGGEDMSDVNATIKAVDEAMDIMDEVSKEIHDLKAHVCFDINEMIAAVEREKWRSEEREENRNQSETLGELCYECKKWGEELTEEWTGLCMSLADLADDAKHVLGEYMRKLNKISRTTEPAQGCIGRPGSEYYVVVVDSRKYPQTAEHIKRAQKMGFSEYVTLDRNGTDERRKKSLKNVERNSWFDRDEWPMAVFREGGAGANVVHLEDKDNRGAGSSIGWQMRKIPDGARVRIRVI